MTVIRNNGTVATYPTRYDLKVVSFDVVDENEDGINEPGERLLVKNIRVQNTGEKYLLDFPSSFYVAHVETRRWYAVAKEP